MQSTNIVPSPSPSPNDCNVCSLPAGYSLDDNEGNGVIEGFDISGITNNLANAFDMARSYAPTVQQLITQVTSQNGSPSPIFKAPMNLSPVQSSAPIAAVLPVEHYDGMMYPIVEDGGIVGWSDTYPWAPVSAISNGMTTSNDSNDSVEQFTDTSNWWYTALAVVIVLIALILIYFYFNKTAK